MKYAPLLALGLLVGFAAPSGAQMLPGGGGMGGGMGGPGGAPAPAAQDDTNAAPPPALPGAGGAAPLATGPKLQKPVTGDPTKALFDAVNKGDSSAAQEAISRGANLNATDQFGETPLDLSIALNRNDITFLLLSARNEVAGTRNEVVGSPWVLNSSSTGSAQGTTHHKVASTQVAAKPKLAPTPKLVATPVPQFPATPGTPDPNAGFLGFGAKD